MKEILWRKASRSTAQGGDCVEVSTNVVDHILIRDSRAPETGHLTLRRATLAALVSRIKSS
ncbi:DUF397 domain-containing protein [Spirillospora sp. CA-253888]